MTAPAQQYAAISRIVARTVQSYASGNDRSGPADQLARAAILIIRDERGAQMASEVAYRIADEMIGTGKPGEPA